MSLVPVFTLKLNQKIFPRLVTVGKYDGKHPCLTAATNGGKVFLHTPHHRLSPSHKVDGASSRLSSSTMESDITLLSIGQQVLSLTAGKLHPDLNYDLLMVGSQTNLLAYDIEQNSEVFYKEVPDGANAMVIGQLSEGSNPLTFVGGNCTIQGVNFEGEDEFWTVTGDNVCSLALCDFNSDGENELLVGSEDYDIRVFKNDELLTEISEAEAVISLCPIKDNRFSYALANGIVGVYGGEDRYWRIKSKNQPICLHSFDLNNDGVPEVITGWSNGKMDVRSPETGNVIYKDTFSSHIAGLVQADYRLDGKEELICCSVDGEVRGYLPSSIDSTHSPAHSSVAPDNKALEELNRKKQNLLLELRNFETNEKIAHSKDPYADMSSVGPMGAIPAGTLLKTEFSAVVPDGKKNVTPHIQLSIKTSNDTKLRTVIIFAEGLFDGESHVVHPTVQNLSNQIDVPLFPDKDVPVDLNIKAFVGRHGNNQFHVFEASRPILRFALYIPCSLDVEPQPQGTVTFELPERIDRVLSWINDNFMYGPGDDAVTTNRLHVAYMSLRTNTPLILTMEPGQRGKITLCTDDMDLAGDVIQSLAAFMNIEDLQVVADFPRQMEDLRTVLTQVDELHKVRQKLTAEMADNSGVIRNLVVRAEDARMMADMLSMKKAYRQLYQLNKDLIMGYKIRSNNHIELLDSLKIVNQAIQKAGRLRVGKPKSLLVSACRTAIKNNEIDTLFRVIKFGAT